MNRKVLCLLLPLLAALFGCKSRVQNLDSVTIAVPYEIDTLDPHARTRLSNYALLSNFYEPLVVVDARLKIQPCLAERWENPDSFTWVIHLRPHVHFHNGKELKPEDVVYSIERLRKEDNLELVTYVMDVTHVAALNSSTVEIRTGKPVPIFLNKLTNVFILSKGDSEANLPEKENGTGPYRLVQWSKGKSLEMIRNEDYWSRKASIRKATYLLNHEPEDAVEALVSGKAQLAQFDFKKMESRVRGLGHYKVLYQDNLFLKYLSYDVARDVTPYCSERSNPFKNHLVRQAIHIGMDRDQLISQLPNYAEPATQPVPAFVFGFNPQIPVAHPDINQAKQLLTQAGYPQGFAVTLHERQILQETGLLVQKQLQRIGIRVTLKMMQDHEFFDALDHGDFSFFLSRIAATIGDASDVLEPQLHTRDLARRYGVRNYIYYSDPEVDALIEQSALILKVDDRLAALQQIMSLLMRDLPWIPLYIDQDVYAVDNSLSWAPRPDSYVLAYDITPAENKN